MTRGPAEEAPYPLQALVFTLLMWLPVPIIMYVALRDYVLWVVVIALLWAGLLALVYYPDARKRVESLDNYVSHASAVTGRSAADVRARVWGSKGIAWRVMGLSQLLFTLALLWPASQAGMAWFAHDIARHEREWARESAATVDRLPAGKVDRKLVDAVVLDVADGQHRADTWDRVAVAYLLGDVVILGVWGALLFRARRKREAVRLVSRAVPGADDARRYLEQAVSISLEKRLL